MTDSEIITALITHDPKVTAQFFFRKCRPLFLSIIRRVFGGQFVSYDEIISELYIHLMENDARRLRQFHYESSLYQWLKTTCIRYCLKLKAQQKVVDEESREPADRRPAEPACDGDTQARMDVEALLGRMKNQRYAKVIRLLMIEELAPEEVARELSVKVDNLYNIKRRAMAALADVALKDRRLYEQK